MAHTSSLIFGRTESGYRLSVVGHGTMQQSRSAEAFVEEAMKNPETGVVVDLCECDYLDSTFLGCLIGLHRQFGASRFRVVAPADRCQKLFGPTRIDRLLRVSSEVPPIIGEPVTISPQAMNAADMARHIMECHRRLADIPGPQQNVFAAIAQQMERELQQRV